MNLKSVIESNTLSEIIEVISFGYTKNLAFSRILKGTPYQWSEISSLLSSVNYTEDDAHKLIPPLIIWTQSKVFVTEVVNDTIWFRSFPRNPQTWFPIFYGEE